ncbi:hypothetical protein G7Z17_g13412 [Cylindrodendrum hubeiense]|uniref:Uncharacterized protein n=1 Tax=Cylindrodendrum hubeiense TaxID=595255 RepID=A0A9P5GSB0_9HYPO|nr:hypothetical protein G7Z17_g13412 [Cylindrodendrum hubeiense]
MPVIGLDNDGKWDRNSPAVDWIPARILAGLQRDEEPQPCCPTGQSGLRNRRPGSAWAPRRATANICPSVGGADSNQVRRITAAVPYHMRS